MQFNAVIRQHWFAYVGEAPWLTLGQRWFLMPQIGKNVHLSAVLALVRSRAIAKAGQRLNW